MDNVRLPAKEDLCLGVTSINCGRGGGDFVREEVVIWAKHVECWVGGVPSLEEIAIGGRWHESHLCGI